MDSQLIFFNEAPDNLPPFTWYQPSPAENYAAPLLEQVARRGRQFCILVVQILFSRFVGSSARTV